jgi:regulator of protease activity HflC (stomatin/prohibitin superfamily)
MSDIESGFSHRMKHREKTHASPSYRVLPLYTDFLTDPLDLDYVPVHSFWHKFFKGLIVLLFLPVSWIWVAMRTVNIPDGCVGLSTNGNKREFLSPGWHFLASPLRRLKKVVNLNSREYVLLFPRGFCVVGDGHVMVGRQAGIYRLLGPGFHSWNDAMFEPVGYASVTGRNSVALGPFHLVTVPPGEIAITENNGTLVMLSENETTGQRCHFLDHANWKFCGMLSTQRQIDTVNVRLTTADRVEVDVTATTAWSIIDAKKSALAGGHTMDRLQAVVHRSAQGVLAGMISVRRVSDTAISSIVQDNGTVANQVQLDHCNAELDRIGVKISEIAIIQMRINDEETRLEIAKIAAIPTKTKELRDVAEAQAASDVLLAGGKARAMVEIANAEANSILLLAEARKKAGEMLGTTDSTAATLARIDATGQALKEAKSTVFFVPPGSVPNLMANQSIVNQGVY